MNKIKISVLYQHIIHVLSIDIANIDNPATVAWLLLEKLFGKTKEELITLHYLPMNEEEKKVLLTWIDELKQNKPLQYILGQVPFLDLWIEVEPPILIPRPETESWCAELIEEINVLKDQAFDILDLCTGSGCLALALADAFPYAQVVAGDINPQAVALAQQNAQKNNIQNVNIILSDLYSSLPQKQYDLIVSNPPYLSEEEWQSIDANVKEWEDKKALVADNDGLYLIEQIIKMGCDYLKTNSNIPYNMWIEIGYKQGTKVVELFKKYDYRDVKILHDYQGHDRVVIGKFIP